MLLGRSFTTYQELVWSKRPYTLLVHMPYVSVQCTQQCSSTINARLAGLTYNMHSVAVRIAHRSRVPVATNSPSPTSTIVQAGPETLVLHITSNFKVPAAQVLTQKDHYTNYFSWTGIRMWLPIGSQIFPHDGGAVASNQQTHKTARTAEYIERAQEKIDRQYTGILAKKY